MVRFADGEADGPRLRTLRENADFGCCPLELQQLAPVGAVMVWLRVPVAGIVVSLVLDANDNVSLGMVVARRVARAIGGVAATLYRDKAEGAGQRSVAMRPTEMLTIAQRYMPGGTLQF